MVSSAQGGCLLSRYMDSRSERKAYRFCSTNRGVGDEVTVKGEYFPMRLLKQAIRLLDSSQGHGQCRVLPPYLVYAYPCTRVSKSLSCQWTQAVCESRVQICCTDSARRRPSVVPERPHRDSVPGYPGCPGTAGSYYEH
eukprot:800761-Rhodomonas_salina.2